MTIHPPIPPKVLKTANKHRLIRVIGSIFQISLRAECRKHVDISIFYTKLLMMEAIFCRVIPLFPRVTPQSPRVGLFSPHGGYSLYIYIFLTNYKKRKKKGPINRHIYKYISAHGSLHLYKKPSTCFDPQIHITRGQPVEGFISRYNNISLNRGPSTCFARVFPPPYFFIKRKDNHNEGN